MRLGLYEYDLADWSDAERVPLRASIGPVRLQILLQPVETQQLEKPAVAILGVIISGSRRTPLYPNVLWHAESFMDRAVEGARRIIQQPLNPFQATLRSFLLRYSHRS